jgi:hypothetical protein
VLGRPRAVTPAIVFDGNIKTEELAMKIKTKVRGGSRICGDIFI